MVEQYRDRRRISRNRQDTASPYNDIDILKIAHTLWLHKFIILGTVAVALLIALLWLSQQTPRYSAFALVQLDVRQEDVIDLQNVVRAVNLDERAIKSEVDILRSHSLASRVVDRLNLTADPYFNPTQETNTVEAREITIANLMRSYTVSEKPRSFSLVVRTHLPDAHKAALIANTIVDEYKLSQLEFKQGASQRANTWLTNKLDALAKNVKASEEAVQQYRKANSLYEQNGVTLNDKQLSELNSDLIRARTDLAGLEAQYKRTRELIKSNNTQSASEVVRFPLIQRLREQETQVIRKEADLAARYGPEHPRLKETRAELRDLRNQIESESNKVLDSLYNDVQVARSRVHSLEQSLNKAENKVSVSSEAAIKLAALEREMNSSRQVYQAFLDRSKETAEQQDLQTPDVRVISYATTPLAPNYPNKLLALLVAIIAGLGISLGIIIILEMLRRGFSNSEDVERVLGYVALGTIGKVPDKKQTLATYIKHKPDAQLAENVRVVWSEILRSKHTGNLTSILITSATANEGKSSIVLALGVITQLQKAGKVVVVDADMRSPSIHNYLNGVHPKFYLDDILEGRCTIKDALVTDDLGVSYILSNPHAVALHAQTYAAQIKDLIAQLEKNFGYVFIDAAPLQAVNDAAVIAPMVSTNVIVAEWKATPKKMVKDALKPLYSSKLPVAGIILNKVNYKHMYGFADAKYYNALKKYYHES